MGIQLLSISYKTANTELRSMFAFREEQKEKILVNLLADSGIDEAVVLTTCNRTEIYCSGEDNKHNLHVMKRVLLKESQTESIHGIQDYILRFLDESAVHHLFRVTSGLDSMVIGEDQILGQVKDAYFFSEERGYLQKKFHLLFRLAITAAKKVKTETLLSKTSVSTASLALKKAEEILKTLSGKKLMIIGASGQIGSIVLKNAMDISGIQIYVTTRKRDFLEIKGSDFYTLVPYHDRYQWMNEMDVIISATTSPHYTVTDERYSDNVTEWKERLFFDLAIPSDIESVIGQRENTWYFCMEDMEELARQNNEMKQESVLEAKEILKAYEEDFLKEILFGESISAIESLKRKLMADESSAEQVLNHFIFAAKEKSNVKELESLMQIINKVVKEGEIHD